MPIGLGCTNNTQALLETFSSTWISHCAYNYIMYHGLRTLVFPWKTFPLWQYVVQLSVFG